MGFSQILEEDFEGTWSPSPSGWYQEELASGGGFGQNSYFIKSVYSGTWSPEPSSFPDCYPPYAENGTAAAWYNIYDAYQDQIDRMATYDIDLSSTTNPIVSFFIYYKAGPEDIRLVASNDGGGTWNDISGQLLPSGSAWKKYSFNLPSEYQVSNARIGFQITVNGGGYDLWIDSVVVFDAPAALTGAKTIDNTQPTAGNNYNSFTDAFDALNLSGVGTGGVVFNVVNGQTFSENPPILTVSGSETTQISFVNDETPGINNPVIESTGDGSNDYSVVVYESSYVTFDGIDINCAGTNFNSDLRLEYGYIIAKNSTHNTITNCTVNLSRSNGNFTTGISTMDGGCDFNTITNNEITDCAGGIFLGDVDDVIFDENNTVSNNIINNLGFSGYDVVFGIKINNQTNVILNNNSIYNMESTTAPVYGIMCNDGLNTTSEIYNCSISDLRHPTGDLRYMAGFFMSYGNHNIHDNVVSNLSNDKGSCVGIDITAFGENYVYNNKFYDINYTGDSYYHASGAYFSSSSHPDAQVYFYNNLIYDIHAESGITDIDNYINASGIYVDQGNISIFYNTVYIADTTTSSSNVSSALFIRNHYTDINLRNNIFVNKTTGTFSKAPAFYHLSSDYSDILDISDNNLYYSGTATSSTPVFYDGTNTANTLADYQSLIADFDQLSITEDVPFVSSTEPYDVHVSTSIPTSIESAGLAIETPFVISTDFEGNLRNSITPDIGAFEDDYIILDNTPPNIVCNLIHNTTSVANYVLNDFTSITDASGVNVDAFKPRLYFKNYYDNDVFVGNTSSDNGWKYVEAENSSSPFSFTIDYSLLYNSQGGNGFVEEGDIIVYFVAAQDLADVPNVGAKPNEDFEATDLDNITSSPDNPNYFFIADLYYDFEADNDQQFWHEADFGYSTDEWERGTPTGGTGYPETLPSGTNCWGTNLDGNYSNNAAYILYSPRFEATENIVLFSFDEFLNIEQLYFDSVKIEYQVNNFLWYQFGEIYSRQDTSWHEKMLGLNLNTGDDFIIRWTIYSDIATSYAGWFIDDFMLRGATNMYYVNYTIVNEDLDPVAYPHIWLDDASAGDYWLGNDDGTKSIPLQNGEHTHIINGPWDEYLPDLDTFTINNKDTNIYVILNRPAYSLTFDISESETGNPIENADISINSTHYYSDASGLVTISDLDAGNYDYSVTATGYISEYGNVDLQSNTTEYVEMEITWNIEETKNKFTIYPNPTNGIFSIYNEQFTITNLTISDVTGKTIIEKTEIQQKETIDLSDFESGVYFIKVKTESGTDTEKIIKQ